MGTGKVLTGWHTEYPSRRDFRPGAQGWRRRRAVVCSAFKNAKAVPLPETYEQLISQVQAATEAALNDGKKLLEIEFPTAGLDSVPGDAEGGIEMTDSMRYMKDFCRLFTKSRDGASIRIFFPDSSEVAEAKSDIFQGVPFQLDYLTKITGFEDVGFGKSLKMAGKVRASDKVFVIAYPYFNVNEMLAVEELHNYVEGSTKQPIIVFNGELDRIRSGYYPPFFYPKLGKLAKNLLPKVEGAYYLHNFKGRLGGKLFRAYPGPWQVFRAGVCIHRQDTMPSLKDVALNILPQA